MQNDINLLSYVLGAFVGSSLVAAIGWRLLRNGPAWRRWSVVVGALSGMLIVVGNKTREFGAEEDVRFVTGFSSSCAQRCVAEGGPAEGCTQLCACQLTKLRATSTVRDLRLWMTSHIVAGAPDAELQQKIVEVTTPCAEQVFGTSKP